ncbi:MAG: hypothetical protein Q4D44_00765 [Eubacteriales bacterium]|nr:hypothetical protein [Eubacteriales bacterium]
MKHKISRLYLYAFLYRFVFLLLAVPVQAVLFEGFSPVFVFFAYFTNIVIFLLITVWGILSLRANFLVENQDKILRGKGIILRREDFIYNDKIRCVTLTRKLLYPITRSVKLTVKGANITAESYLKTPDAKALSQRLIPREKKHRVQKYPSDFWGLLLVCAGFSNVLWGLFTLIPMLNKTANFIGDERAAKLFELFRFENDLILSVLPSSLRILAGFFFFIWFSGLLIAFLKHINFTLRLWGDAVSVSKGLITKTVTEFPKSSLSAVTLRQSLLLLIFKRFSLKGHLPVKGTENFLNLSLGAKEKEQKEILCRLGFIEENPIRIIKPKGFPLWGYCYKAILFLLFTLLLMIFPLRLPLLFYPWVGIFLLSLASVFFSYLGFRKSKVTVYESFITISYASPFHLCKTYIPKEKITARTLIQSPYQRLRKTCTLKIHIRGDAKTCLKIISVQKEEATQLT